MVSLVRMLVVACAGLAMTGCFPMRFSGYRPTGPGELEGGYCIAGIRDWLNMQAPGGVEIHMRATALESKQVVVLDTYLVVPNGRTVRLLADTLAVTHADTGHAEQFPITRITAGGPIELEALATMAGLTSRSETLYSLWLTPRGPGSDFRSPIVAVPRFTVQLPAMMIDGEEFQPGPVAFETYREWGMYYCVQ